VIKATLKQDELGHIEHLSIDIDDMEDEDILVHLPRMVRFIDRGLRGEKGNAAEDKANPPNTSGNEQPASGAVFVHCAMGKSRSVSAVIAYLLWKYPRRFQAPTSQQAVTKALEWIRRSRPIAGPNDGFMNQLELWHKMGCPADSDDAVEKHPAYQRWLYKREVEDAARIGRAPDRFRFEDEETSAEGKPAGGQEEQEEQPGRELRCKRCRRVLATSRFIIQHEGRRDGKQPQQSCPHYFVEALSWMRPILEEGELDGRLICPNTKCAASIGRYAWQGFKCSCGQWVAPAFSLQTSKVDEVNVAGKGINGSGTIANRMAALNIRMPPGMGPTPATLGGADRAKENL
jgi:dual specificity phosphatase 12